MKKRLLLTSAAALLVMASCSTSNKMLTSDIIGTWGIQSAMNLSTATADSHPFITFGQDGRMNGNASVNIFNGKYALKGSKLRLSSIGMTRMMGGSMNVEDAITNALNTAASISAEGGKAYILNSKADTVMTLIREK